LRTLVDADVLTGNAGTERVVCQRNWCAKHRHDAVARELAQRSAVALHHSCGPVEQFGHDLAQAFRTFRRCDVHRPDDVYEQHRYLLVLRGWRGRRDQCTAGIAGPGAGARLPHKPGTSLQPSSVNPGVLLN
jgi:hypothetical protein